MFGGSVIAAFGGRVQTKIVRKYQFCRDFFDDNELGQTSIWLNLADGGSAELAQDIPIFRGFCVVASALHTPLQAPCEQAVATLLTPCGNRRRPSGLHHQPRRRWSRSSPTRCSQPVSRDVASSSRRVVRARRRGWGRLWDIGPPGRKHAWGRGCGGRHPSGYRAL